MNSYDLLSAYHPHTQLSVGPTGTRSARDFLQHVASVAAHLPEPSVRAQHDQSAHAAANGAPCSELLVMCQDRYYLAVVLLAAWQRGHVIALPPNTRDQTLRELGDQCTLSLHDGAGAGHDVRAWFETPAAALPYPALPARQPLVTIYTSGSTGTPTACRKTAAHLLGEAQTLQRTFALTPDSCVLATVPAHHIYGLLFSVLLPLFAGARFVRDTPLLAHEIEERARHYDANILISVPAHLRVLADSELSSFANIRRVFSSGAPLPSPTAEALHRRFDVEVTEVLGSTETGGYAYRAAHLGARFVPFSGVSVRVDQDGQLLLCSPLLDSQLTQPITCPDRIELAEDGSFRHLGRSDGVVKVGGMRVALPELEARVRALSDVLDVAALAVDAGSARGQEIWLVVASERGRELEELRPWLLRHYAPVQLPRRIRFVESLPREATGKLMRARLLELFRVAKSKDETTQP